MDLAKVGDKVACSCKGGPHQIVSGASTAKVDGLPIARVGDKSSCGATITSGASWYAIEGVPAAIRGSATSCGGCIESASTAITGSPTTIGTHVITANSHVATTGTTEGRDDASPGILSESNAEIVYEYMLDATKVTMNQPAYLLVEGVGVNGGYSFKNNIAIEGNTLHVSSQGWAPSTQAPESGSAVFTMRAELKDGNQLLEASRLDNNGINAWPDDPRYTPIGHATIHLPEPKPNRALSLHFQGTFTYQTSAGSVSPMPPSTSKTLYIHVVAQ